MRASSWSALSTIGGSRERAGHGPRPRPARCHHRLGTGLRAGACRSGDSLVDLRALDSFMGSHRCHLSPRHDSRIDGVAFDEDLVVQMRPGGVPRRPRPADLGACADLLVPSDVECREMSVETADLTSVIDDDGSAISAAPAGVGHDAGGRCVDRSAARCADVDTRVEVPSPERPARAEAGIDPALHGPSRAQVGECFGRRPTPNVVAAFHSSRGIILHQGGVSTLA